MEVFCGDWTAKHDNSFEAFIRPGETRFDLAFFEVDSYHYSLPVTWHIGFSRERPSDCIKTGNPCRMGAQTIHERIDIFFGYRNKRSFAALE